MTILRYGNNSSVQIELADCVSPGEMGVPRGQPLSDTAAATMAALKEPLDYPSLAQSTTPVDRVVLALDCGLPEAAQVTAAVVRALADAGIDPDGVTVLQSPADCAVGADDPCSLVPDGLRERITGLTHDPDDRRALAYLAADKAGEAILVNRALHEADVVLPIGCLRGETSAGYFGIHGCLYPTFSDTKTLQRFRGFGSLNGRGQRRRERVADVEHVACLLGINFTIQLVPAGGGKVMHVLAGQSDSVRRRGQELYHAAWNRPPAPQVGLVVATIEGGAGQQTWENVGRALQVASRFVEEDGAIALCCDLSAPPGPAMQCLANGTSREAALREVGKQRPADALTAATIARTLDRSKVYLLSRLDPAVVEELDMVPVASPDELARLAQRHSSCVLLSNAPYVTAVE
jgi:nickel-dependent lactate racemase